MPKSKNEASQFLNVDLDIYSRLDLTPLVRVLGRNALVLYSGREKRLFSAHLELSKFPKNADEAIRGFIALIRGLPHSARKLWNMAASRSFNIGIQSGEVPDGLAIGLTAATLRDVSSVRAEIVVTIYSHVAKSRFNPERKTRFFSLDSKD